MSTLAEQWIQEGLQQGLQQGLAAERQLLLRQIRHRFGSVVAQASAPLLEQVADAGALEELGELMLDCPDGEAWLKALASRASG